MAATDFCIAGFPKCGTTAVAQFFQQSPLFHVAEMSDRGHFEAPFFKGDGPIPEIPGVPGRINGHKCSSCAWSIKVLHRIHCANRACLFLFCVRDARSALVSWRAMHRAMALNEKTTWHVVHRTAETREFFSTCSLAEYFREYAADRLRHAESLERFHSALPHARFAIISQRKLATDAAGVMRALHHSFGVEAPEEYLKNLPAAHTAHADNAKNAEPLDEETDAALRALDRDLVRWIRSLAPGQNLTLGEAEFTP